MLTFRKKLAYAIGRLGSSITIDMTDLFTGFVYYAFFGLKESPFLAFLGVAIGKLVIAFTSYVSGYLSDRTKTNIGRRKPFIVIGAPLLAFSFFMLYTPHIFINGISDESVIFGYLLLFNSLYQGVYGFLLTPYQSWLPEITTELERLEVSGYQNTVNLFAFIVGAGTSFLLPAIMGGKSDDFKHSDFQIKNEFFPFLTNGLLLTLIVFIFASTVIISFLPSLLSIKEKETTIPERNLKEELKIVLGNQNYLGWVMTRGVIAIMISGLLGIVLAWITDVLDFGTVEYLIFGGVLLISIFAGYILWINFGNKYGKTRTYIYSMGYLAAVMPLMIFVGQINLYVPLIVVASFFAVLVALGLSAYYLLPYAIVGDIVEEDELRTGESRAGAYYGFEAVPLNAFQFLGYLLVGALIDFLPDFTNYRDITFSSGYLVFGPLAAICILISVLIFKKYVNADPLKDKTEN